MMKRVWGGLCWMIILAVMCGCQSLRSVPENNGINQKQMQKNPLAVVIKPSFLVNNPCYTAGRKIEVKGLMLHSVGCPQPSAEAFVNSWNRKSFDRACVHGFIDAHSGIVYQTLPWSHRGWHGASGPKGSVNNTHIGVEMCEAEYVKYVGGATFVCSNPEATKTMARRTYDSAVELFAFLCDKFNLEPLEDGVIISHAEGHARGVASGHADPEHLWRQLNMDLSMDGFRQDVKNKLDEYRTYKKFLNKKL